MAAYHASVCMLQVELRLLRLRKQVVRGKPGIRPFTLDNAGRPEPIPSSLSP